MPFDLLKKNLIVLWIVQHICMQQNFNTENRYFGYQPKHTWKCIVQEIILLTRIRMCFSEHHHPRLFQITDILLLEVSICSIRTIRKKSTSIFHTFISIFHLILLYTISGRCINYSLYLPALSWSNLNLVSPSAAPSGKAGIEMGCGRQFPIRSG